MAIPPTSSTAKVTAPTVMLHSLQLFHWSEQSCSIRVPYSVLRVLYYSMESGITTFPNSDKVDFRLPDLD